MNFTLGNDYNSNKSYSRYVRAVRSGQVWLLGHLLILSPAQASFWDSGEIMPITWQTQSLSGNVKITLSRDGGKTFETIADSTPNDGSYNWTVSGNYSVNCVLKIKPLNDVTKAASQGLFVIESSSYSPVTLTDVVIGLQILASIDASPAGSNADADKNGITEL